MNLVLIGYRGTGKSTVARLLADRLGRRLVSTDAEVIRRAGRSIPDIVAQFGWEHFRDLESQVCRDLSGEKDLVIDTGGGAILRDANADALRAGGRLYWLTATVETIRRRIEGDSQRPSLTGKSFVDEIADVLREREPKYRAAAHATVPTDGVTPDAVMSAILAAFDASRG